MSTELDESYLGFIRFGAGNGCPPCATPMGWRLMRAIKAAHGWPYYGGAGAGLRHLSCEFRGNTWSGSGGVREINRLTGLSSGTYLDVSADPGVIRTSEIRTRVEWQRPSDTSTGETVLGHPYDIGTLHADAMAQLYADEAHPAGIPASSYWEILRAETGSSAGLWTPNNVLQPRHFVGQSDCIPWLGLSGPVDGRIIPRAVSGGIDSARGISVVGNSQFTFWSFARPDAYWMHRLHLQGHRGFWSRADYIARMNPFGGGPDGTILADLGKRYYRHRGGALDLLSLPISPVYEPTTDTGGTYAVTVILLGDAPPSGEPYTDTGFEVGAGTAC